MTYDDYEWTKSRKWMERWMRPWMVSALLNIWMLSCLFALADGDHWAIRIAVGTSVFAARLMLWSIVNEIEELKDKVKTLSATDSQGATVI